MVLQPRKSSVLNSQKSRRKLAHQPSKLDLIDDTTLTSLPFAPPPPREIRRSNSNLSDVSKSSSGVLAEDIMRPIPSSNSTQDSIVTVMLHEYDSTVDGDVDDTMEEPEDPIVLVEDYLTDQTAESEVTQRLIRKKSLATFKQRYYSSSERHDSAATPRLTKRALPDQEQTQYGNSSEDLEAIFGKLPGADGLKHCAFCNKPLYEISSIISNTCPLSPPSANGNLAELYNEFVCWDCISVYEQFMCELDADEAVLKHQKKRESLHLVDMLNSLRNCVSIQPPKKQTKHEQTWLETKAEPKQEDKRETQQVSKSAMKHEFSPDLLGRLHYLSSVSEPTSGSWLENLVTKLKWNNNLECITLHYPIRDNNAI